MDTSSQKVCTRVMVYKCEQCGRVGTRQFDVMPAATVEMSWGPMWIKEFVQCSNKNACRKRWPKHEVQEF